MEKIEYIILNKPVEYNLTDAFDLLGEIQHRYTHALNTLSKDSEGLVVLAPGDENAPLRESEYEVTIDDYLSRDAQKILKKGIHTEKEFISGITLIEEKHKGKRSVVRLSTTQNTDTQIRNMFETIGYHVTGIRCIRIGEFKLGVLSIGKWKKIITN